MSKKYEFVPGDEITIAPGRTVKRIRALVAISCFASAGSLGGYIESEKSLSQDGDAWVSGNAQVYGDAWVSGNARVSGDAQVYGDARVSGNAWVSDNARVYGNARVSGDAQVYGDARVSGNAWVSDNARVSGNAWVSGNARVYGDARVSRDAQVYGDAWVSGDAWVYGDAWVSGNARVSGDARVSRDAQVYGNGLIFWASKVGTENGTLTAYNTKDNSIELARGCFTGSIDEFLSKSEKEHDDRTHLEYRLLIEVAVSRITHARKD